MSDHIMDALTPQGVKIIEYVAQRYSVSTDAVLVLLFALRKGHGKVAQFSHPDLGGFGQWSRGGMTAAATTMIGDMSNTSLKAKVEGLCSELAELLRRENESAANRSSASPAHAGPAPKGPAEFSLFVHEDMSSSGWWGVDFGTPTSSGSQKNVQYAYFRPAQRLAVKIGGLVSVWATGDHDITGISQQQGRSTSLVFTSQSGLVRLDELTLVSGVREGTSERPVKEQGTPTQGLSSDSDPHTESDDIFRKLERLADLNRKGIVSDTEFAEKKQELLRRI